MFQSIHPDNPQPQAIRKAVNCLTKGGLIIYPANRYGLCCDMRNMKAVEKMAELKGTKWEKATFSMVCKDLSQVAQYTVNFDKSVFKVLKHHLPGAFTFILKAGGDIPRALKKRKSMGIQMPETAISMALIEELGVPLLNASLPIGANEEYPSDPQAIYERFQHDVDMVLDGGAVKNDATTVVDCLDQSFEVIRQGAGILEV